MPPTTAHGAHRLTSAGGLDGAQARLEQGHAAGGRGRPPQARCQPANMGSCTVQRDEGRPVRRNGGCVSPSTRVLWTGRCAQSRECFGLRRLWAYCTTAAGCLPLDGDGATGERANTAQRWSCTQLGSARPCGSLPDSARRLSVRWQVRRCVRAQGPAEGGAPLLAPLAPPAAALRPVMHCLAVVRLASAPGCR